MPASMDQIQLVVLGPFLTDVHFRNYGAFDNGFINAPIA